MSGEPEHPIPTIEVEVAAGQVGAWVTANRTLDPTETRPSTSPPGRRPAPQIPGRTPRGGRVLQQAADEGYRQQVEYQPASRFWALQWRETGLLLALAAGLTGFCFWRIRRDLT